MAADSPRNSYEGLGAGLGDSTSTGSPGQGDGSGLLSGGLDKAMERVDAAISEAGGPLADWGSRPGDPRRAEAEGSEGAGEDAGPEEEETAALDGGEPERGEDGGDDSPSEPRSKEDTAALGEAIRTLKRHGFSDDQIGEMGEAAVLSQAERVKPLVERNDQTYAEVAELKRRLSEAERLLGSRTLTAGHQPDPETGPNQTNISELARSFASEANLDDQAASAFERLLAHVQAPLAEQNAQLRERFSEMQAGLLDMYWDRAEGSVAQEIPELRDDPKVRTAVLEAAREMTKLDGLGAQDALAEMQSTLRIAAQAALYGRSRNQQASSERRAHQRQGQPRSSGRRGQRTKVKSWDDAWDDAIPDLERKHGVG